MLSKHRNNVYGEGQPSHTNYEIIDPGANEISIIRITEGKFSGVEFRFGNVSFSGDRLSFKTEIVKKPLRLFFVSLKKSGLFTEVTGNILLHLIQTNIAECNKFLVG
ncbi:hypothetical protein DEEACLCL_00126 [Salmonella phage CRW-SP2]|nr:hypothetical protein DEEACLCL_00126 [Salmonella phage CRW-SP2]